MHFSQVARSSPSPGVRWWSEDGTEFSGWWFGDSVGGQQVWSRSVETGKGKVRGRFVGPRGRARVGLVDHG